MAAYDVTAVNHGTYDISGSSLVTALATINIINAQSGSNVHMIPVSNGQQIVLIEVQVE